MGILEDQVVIVTGCSSGIGLAAATATLDEGAHVIGVDLSPSPPSLASHAGFHFVQCDLTEEAAPKTVTETALQMFGGRIDALLNVAGVRDRFESVDTLSDSMWERCIAVNLTAPVKLMREVIKIMKEQKSGSIVNVASKAGTSGASAGVAYTATVETGIIDRSSIDLNDADGMDAIRPIVLAHMPDFSPPIAVEDIAQAMVFLASSHSSRINGAVIPIDNAWSTI
ncbi:hypothetical protein MHUMG1_08924 [Metarhizium humberi]|uniref:Hydroxynaphthalene reductase-like protein Arp2 n=1 Tax=Metarhizium humberi TaxID=2596975 RepID=A0A9P8M472_9HYPO|nr:hypothetical protein MHUMG1_08924 [Metarhizium humberi]